MNEHDVAVGEVLKGSLSCKLFNFFPPIILQICSLILAELVSIAFRGDGTLTAFDIRKHKKKVQSESLDAGLMSILAIKVTFSFILSTIWALPDLIIKF